MAESMTTNTLKQSIEVEAMPTDFTPPEDTSAQRRWVKRLTPLMEHPGRWFRIAQPGAYSNVKSTVANLRDGLLTVPDGLFEYAQDGESIYARFMGE